MILTVYFKELKIYGEVSISQGTLVCIEGKGEREGPLAQPAPTFSVACGSTTTGWIFFKFDTHMQ